PGSMPGGSHGGSGKHRAKAAKAKKLPGRQLTPRTDAARGRDPRAIRRKHRGSGALQLAPGSMAGGSVGGLGGKREKPAARLCGAGAERALKPPCFYTGPFTVPILAGRTNRDSSRL